MKKLKSWNERGLLKPSDNPRTSGAKARDRATSNEWKSGEPRRWSNGDEEMN
jgi:hypothetical protein